MNLPDVGNYRNQCHITLHTHQAKNLVNGERKPKGDNKRFTIVGLILFARLVKKAWYAAKADNPYADLVLIEVERRLKKAAMQLEKDHQFIDRKLQDSLSDLHTQLVQSSAPVRMSFEDTLFSTPHARWGGMLIGQYDLLIRKLDTAKSIPTTLSKSAYERYLRRSTRVLRGAFCAALTFKEAPVTRADILNASPLGQATVEKLGLIPMDVLRRELKPEFGPHAPSTQTDPKALV